MFKNPQAVNAVVSQINKSHNLALPYMKDVDVPIKGWALKGTNVVNSPKATVKPFKNRVVEKNTVKPLIGKFLGSDQKGLGNKAAKVKALPKGTKVKDAYNKVSVKEANPLLQEAKKYKSADEFVDKIADKYHWTDAIFDEFNKSFRWSANWNTPTNKWWIFFTDNMDLARTFGKNIKKWYIQINKPKIIDAKWVWYWDKFKDYWKFKFYLNDVFENIDNQKYDWVIVKNYKDAWKYGNDEILSTQYIPLNESQIKTESQLKQIREEANGKPKVKVKK